MRSRRLSFVAGWVALALLAVVGFAAFGTPDSSDDGSQAEAAAASIGHTAGAYAGLTFALLGNDSQSSPIVASAVEDESDGLDEAEAAEAEAAPESDPEGTIATPTAGWLSQVEVRALVSRYFEPTDVNMAVRIAWCESRFDPAATDLRTGGVGLFNHLPQYWAERAANAGFPGAEATDPEASTAAAAWEVYNGGGWEIFNCR